MSRTVIEDRNEVINPKSLKPQMDYLLVEEVDRTITKGGIVIPDTANKGTELLFCRVLEVGNAIPNQYRKETFPIELNRGDVILTIEYMGERMKVKGKEYRFLHEHGAWAKLVSFDPESYEVHKIELRFDCILLEPQDETRTMSGILHLPNGENKSCEWRFGHVLQTGPGRWFEKTLERKPVEVNEGEKVVFRRYAGAEVMFRGKLCRIVQEQDILGVWDE